MKIIFGLGNPEKQFDNTPHNIGFSVVDKLCQKLGGSFSKKKLNGLVAECFLGYEKLLIVKPQTYMNSSGECVVKYLKKFKIPFSDALIVLDDIDLPAGDVRFRAHGSAGTHNGLRNIVLHCGENIPRLRIGVGRPPEYMDLGDFVLKKFDAETLNKVENGENLALEKIEDFVLGKLK